MSTVEQPSRVRTHEVTNQPPPLLDYNVFETDRVMGEAVRREGAEWAVDRISAVGEIAGRGRRARARPPRQREPAEAPDPRPLRQPDRRAGVPPRLARADAARHRAPAPFAALGGAPAGRARRPRRRVHVLLPGRGRRRLSDLDDLLGGAGAPQAARAGRGMGAANPLQRLRPAPDRGRREGGLALRHGDDREAGRLRRAGQHHGRPTDQRRRPRGRVRDHRPQVVLLRPPVRRVPRPRPDRGRHLLLPDAAPAPGWRAQPLPAPAAQGQARQSLQRVLGDRVRRRLDAPGRRGRRRSPNDHRDGQSHPPRLRERERHGHARRRRPGDQPCLASLDFRQAPGGPAR